MELTTQRLQLPPLGLAIDQRPSPAVLSARRPSEISFATISDFTAFEALGQEWTSLFEGYGKPHQVFQTFDWLAIWASLYLDGRTHLAVVTGRVEGRLVLVWPLVVGQTCGLRVLSSMGEPLSQYGDALMAADLDDAAADAAFDYVMALPVDVISLRRIRDDSALAPLLNRRLGAPTNRQASPFVDFADVPSVDAFEKRFSGKLRASRRRRRRRLEERGAVTFVHHGPSPEAATLVAMALRFKREWARQTGVLAPALRDPRFERFFVRAALAGARAPNLRVSALRCGAELLGVEISVVSKGCLVGHVLAPHPAFGQLGIGGILAEFTVVNALEQGYAAIDLLAPSDVYKLEWTKTSVGVGDYCVSTSMRGHLYTRVWLRFGRDALKAFVHRLQPLIALMSRRGKRDSGL